MAKLPNAERAVLEIGKLRDYSLNMLHEVGKHKARVFQAALGLTIDDAEWLRERILESAHSEEARIGTPSRFGIKYVIDITLTRDARSAVVRTSWIIEHGVDFARLTSCYVK